MKELHEMQETDTEENWIEEEDRGTEEQIIKPYDPDKIKVDHQTVNLGSLFEMLQYEEIDMMPDFQREAGLWSDEQQSQLIESVLLGLPLPSFYFSVDKKTDKWLIVDGLQRLTAFKRFWIEKILKLNGLEFLSGFKDKGVDDLTRAEIRRITGFKVNLYVIEKETPERVKFLIFKRVNTGGLVLTPQEIRHALNQGIPADFVKELADLEEFKQATDYKVRSKRQDDRDFVNRFLAFYLLGYEEKYAGELDAFMNDGMIELAKISEQEREKAKAAFKRTMDVCFQIFGNDAFRKRRSLDQKRIRIAKAIFDTVSVNIALKTFEEQEQLIKIREAFINGLMNLLNNDEVYQRAVSTGTAQRSKVKKRFDAVKELINQILES